MAAPTTTAYQIVEMLRRHYQPDNRPPAGIFAPEIQSPCGRRRADVIWMPTTVAGGRGLHGHEIKVTRADVQVELADPTKAEPWAQYCSRWWLVVAHPALLDGLDVPEAWGVLAPPSGRRTRTMTVVRPAPPLIPIEPYRGVAKLASWLMYDQHNRLLSANLEHRTLRRDLDRLRAERDQLRASGARRDDPLTARVAKILSLVDQATTEHHVWANADDASIAAAIVDHLATADAADAVRSAIDAAVQGVERLMDPFRHAKPAMEKAARLAAGAARTGAA